MEIKLKIKYLGCSFYVYNSVTAIIFPPSVKKCFVLKWGWTNISCTHAKSCDSRYSCMVHKFLGFELFGYVLRDHQDLDGNMCH